ncbi:cohesin domain-containing protein [Bowmanella dokdonensis]|uniref:Cohesin domain-containing protein n=1 Tax=Bowmanella dokdonensis TaxID=751969 RepID=A0A939IR40_9ALTE|nr:cohesin domain-containing protein [Bowmanella dokdonensis]MBN7825242.1 hypothetical protein [Bowmanella dokdonensis]
MKKFIALLILLAGTQAQASLLSFSLDKSQYAPGQTITAELYVSDFGSPLGGFFAELLYDPAQLTLLGWEFGTGLDGNSLQFASHDRSLGSLMMDEYADLFADQNWLAGLQGTRFMLARFSFQAIGQGQQSLALGSYYLGLLSHDNQLLEVDAPAISFKVSAQAVSEPVGLWLMLPAGMWILRRRLIRWHQKE